MSADRPGRDGVSVRRVATVACGAAALVLLATGGMLMQRRDQSLDGRRLSAWTRDLASPDTGVRSAAVRTLATAAPRSPAAAHALLEALADSGGDEFHLTVAEALVRLGPEARIAVPRLVTMLTDEHPRIRAQAAKTLGQIAGATGAPVLPLGRALSDPDSGVRMAAAEALGRLGAAATPARNALLIAARDSITTVRLEALRALAGLPRDTVLTLPVLIRALDDASEQARLAAVYGVARYEGAAAAAVPGLRRALGDAHFGMRSAAAYALGRIGVAAREAIPELRRALADPDSSTRVAAAVALSRVSASPPWPPRARARP